MGRATQLVDSSDKLQRKLVKVERKRKALQVLCSLQLLATVPFGVYSLWLDDAEGASASTAGPRPHSAPRVQPHAR